MKAALFAIAFAAFAGCAQGPAVRLEGDAIRFKPAARTEFIGPYTLVNARSRTAIKAMQRSGDEWVVPIPDIGTSAAGSCLVIADAWRRIVPLRSGPDPSGFRFVAYADLAAAEQSWRLAQTQAEQLRASLSDERAAYHRAVNWLNESPTFRDNRCLRPAAKPVPPRPPEACEPALAMDRGREVCMLAAVISAACSEGGSQLTEQQRLSGLELAASRLAVSASCSALGSAIQGEAPSLGSWLTDVLIDGPFFDCMTQTLRPSASVLAPLACVIPGVFFFAKLEHCAKTPAQQCSHAYDRWQSEARQALDEPGRVFATCQESVRLRDRGLANVQDIEQRQVPAAERLAAQRRSAFEAAKTRVQKLSATAQSCGAN